MSRLDRIALASLLVVAGFVATAFASPMTAQEATPSVDCPTTTVEENIEMVHRWFQALAEGTPEDVAALAAEDIIYHHPARDAGTQTGGADNWAEDRQNDYPDLEATVDQIVAGEDRVAAYVIFSGTHQGDTEDDRGIPSTGRPNEWVVMAMFRFECGLIAELWSVADDLNRLINIGVITEEELQTVEEVATPTA